MLRRLCLSALLCVCAATAFAQDGPSAETAGKITSLLDGTGYKYQKVGNATWAISFEGEKNSSVDVLIVPSKSGKSVFVLSVIVENEKIDDKPAALRALLSLNGTIDDVLSVVRDNDDDYVITARHTFESLDVKSFKQAISDVASASDDAYGLIKSALP